VAYNVDSSKPLALGAIDPGIEVGAQPAPFQMGPALWFVIAVAAGVTTWWITSKLSKRR
jgi:hypothetical protein